MKHSTFSSLIPRHGEHLESAEPLGTEAGVLSLGAGCPLSTSHSRLCHTSHGSVLQAISMNLTPSCVLLLETGQFIARWRKATLWGHFTSSHSLQKCYRWLYSCSPFRPGIPCLVSTPSLGSGEQELSPKTSCFC